MGKGKKPQNEEEVLGQIFDFIFKEAKKKPDKRKPIKPTGISTSKEVVDGLAAALEMPGLYVTDQVLANLNDALTIEFGRIKANESGSLSAKLTTTSLISFLSDPNKFFDKPKAAAKMGIREAMKASFMGRAQQELIANAWAHKYNLDLDAKKAIRGHYQADRIGAEAEAGRAFATAAGVVASARNTDDSRKFYVASRSADLVGREIFGRTGWESMSDERKVALQKALLRGNDAVKDYLTNTYTGTSARLVPVALSRYDALRTSMGLKNSTKDKAFDLYDLNSYNTLEVRNIEGRINDMKLYIARNPGLSINEKTRIELGIQQLEQASVIVSGNHLDLKNINSAKIELRRKVADYKNELQLAQRGGNKDKARYYRDQIKNLKRGNRELNSMRFWGTVGAFEGWTDSFKNVMGGVGATNAITSVLDGSFYDKNRNSFYLPVKEETIKFGSYAWDLKDENGKKHTEKHDEEIKIFLAAEGGNKLSSTYKKLMTNVYYLTPRSILRTLFVNGEGFIYLSYKNAQSAMKKLGKGGAIDFNRLMKDSAYRKSLKRLGINADSLFVTRGLAQVFSFGQRKRDMIKTWMDDHLYRKLRQRVYNSLIRRIRDKEALALLEKWLVKGGFEVVGKALAIGLLNMLGIVATGGLGSFIVPILSGVVVDVLYGAVKIIAQVILLVGLGIIGFVFFFSSADKKAFDLQAYVYPNVVPGEVVTNPNYKGTSEIVDPNDPGGPMDPFIGGVLPDGEKCLLGTGSFHCSQGPYGSYSHQNVAAIDVSSGAEYFYAPAFCGDNNCTVTYSGSTSCTAGYAGGMMIFSATYGGNTYQFTLIHVNPKYGVGAKLSSGERVARVMTLAETTNACSSGKHIHIQARMNGAIVNPRDVLNNSTSSGGFACNISECDK